MERFQRLLSRSFAFYDRVAGRVFFQPALKGFCDSFFPNAFLVFGFWKTFSLLFEEHNVVGLRLPGHVRLLAPKASWTNLFLGARPQDSMNSILRCGRPLVTFFSFCSFSVPQLEVSSLILVYFRLGFGVPRGALLPLIYFCLLTVHPSSYSDLAVSCNLFYTNQKSPDSFFLGSCEKSKFFINLF